MRFSINSFSCIILYLIYSHFSKTFSIMDPLMMLTLVFTVPFICVTGIVIAIVHRTRKFQNNQFEEQKSILNDLVNN